MGFSYTILEQWEKRGEDNKSKHTYDMIKSKLKEFCSDLIMVDDNGENVFLQGSYANHTNIKDDSDIDVVVLASDVFKNNAREVLSGHALEKFNEKYSNVDYTIQDFKNDLYRALSLASIDGKSLGLVVGKKTIKFNINEEFSNYVSVDIVPAFEYRNYINTNNADKDVQLEGIAIFDREEHDVIVNYPKLHKKNGEEKNKENRTNGNYKETIRIFKQIKKHLIDNNIITENLMPSYCLECILYNVPDYLFKIDLVDRIESIILWLLKNINSNFIEQNGIYKIFEHSLDIDNAILFFKKCKLLSDNWGKIC